MDNTKNPPTVGQRWKSDSLNQTFLVTGQPETLPGFAEWSNSRFIGHRAQRTSDRALALVGLTEKPEQYPYDFVLFY